MKEFLVKLSNIVGSIIAVIAILLAALAGGIAICILWIASLFILDRNGNRRSTGGKDLLDKLVASLEELKAK